jgi:hypothetical protein
MGDTPGIPGWFILVFILIAATGIGTSIWRFSVLRSGGLNPFVAREQLEARLNETLSATAAGPPAPQSLEQRLAELDDLHARGVISDQEHADGRARLISGG